MNKLTHRKISTIFFSIELRMEGQGMIQMKLETTLLCMPTINSKREKTWKDLFVCPSGINKWNK